MLLERLAAYGRDHRDATPAFHREREFRWVLDVRTGDDGTITSLRLNAEKDPDKPSRGTSHTVPAATRTVGVAPNLAADDVQYVLGWGDDTTKQQRVAQCHEAYRALLQDWAQEVPAQQDPVPHALVGLYRSGMLASLERPEGMRAKDGVLTKMNGVYAHTSSSAAGFWTTRVGAKKGSGRTGVCMVCRRVRPLANTIPGKVSAALVPGASNDAALVSINERVFGYDLVAQLTHTPVCMDCADDVMTGLTGVLSSEHTIAFSGQDTRLAWWVADSSESDLMQMLFAPDPDSISALFDSIRTGKRPPGRVKGRFCWLAVGGQVARIMVREWIDMPLAAEGAHAIDHDKNIAAWFEDHTNTPRRTTAVTLRDGTLLPPGNWNQDIVKLAKCLGRWDKASKQYRPFGAKNADRPDQVLRELLRVAVFDTSVPQSLRAHLIHRIRSDGRVDDSRAALIRLALVRHYPGKKDITVPTALDETRTEPAYVAGRVFAVLEEIQRYAHRRPRIDKDDPGEQHEAEKNTPSGEVNSAFGDRFFRRAVDTPRPVLMQGRKEASAWLAKIRRRPNDAGSAIKYTNRLKELNELVDSSGGFPMRNNLWQQEQFVLGYDHQRAYRSAKNSDAAQA